MPDQKYATVEDTEAGRTYGCYLQIEKWEDEDEGVDAYGFLSIVVCVVEGAPPAALNINRDRTGVLTIPSVL